MRKVFSLTMMFLFLSFWFSDFPAIHSVLANNENEFARWSELQSGQIGYLDSVFEGTEVERIKVRYLGTTPHPALPNEKAIVIALIDKKRAPEGATAVAGTSGSPVYFKVRGKLRLVGAAAFMFNDFPIKGTIMGVTPIEAMLSDQNTAPNVELPRTVKVDHFGELSVRWLPIRFDKQSAPSASQEQSTSRRPEPGDSVTSIFPGGNGAICTVTYVRDDRFWACGHTILEHAASTSEVAFPSYRTQITTTLFSARDSYKLYGSDLEFLGTITRVRSSGIEGQIHERK